MTIPDQAIPASEAAKYRDLMNADEDKSTENLSTISRSLAIGLALVTYTFFIGDKNNDFVASNFLGLLAASVLGVLALTADALHYLFAMLQVRLMRRQIKQEIDTTGGTLTINSVDRFNKNIFYWLRWAMFWAKLVLVAFGGSVIILIILRSASAFAQNGKLGGDAFAVLIGAFKALIENPVMMLV